MIFKTLQIVWHDQLPILSCDFHGSGSFVTSGADHEIKVWQIVHKGDKNLNVAFQGSVSNHSRAVNCVRFHGEKLVSAGDGGEVMLWGPSPENDPSLIQTWKVTQLLRGHADDVIDVEWSTDGTGIVSTSIDNNVILWDTHKGKSKRSFNGHRHYVQGVTWDPLGEHILTQSTDRTMRVHRARASKKRARVPANDMLAAAEFVQAAIASKRPLLSTEPAATSRAAASPSGKQPVDAPSAEPPSATAASQSPQDSAGRQQPSATADRPASQKQAVSRTTYIFQDECLNTFFRRLSFSPEGSFVVAPAATLGPLAQAPQCASAIALFSRANLSRPLALLPTLTSASTCVRFCPVFFASTRASSPANSNQETHTQVAGEGASGAGDAAAAAESCRRAPFDLGYKLVYAVGTTDSLFLFDTEDVRPLAVLGAIHLKHITDIAWSPDGRYLVASSHDGYCTVVSFEPGELGEPLKNHRHDAMSVRTEMAQRRPPPKAPKPKKGKDGPATKAKVAQQAILVASNASPKSNMLATGQKVRKIQATLVPEPAATTAAPGPGVASEIPARTPATSGVDAAPPVADNTPAGEATPEPKRTPSVAVGQEPCDESMSLGNSDSEGSEPESTSNMDEGDAVEPSLPGSSIAFLAAQAGQQAAGLDD